MKLHDFGASILALFFIGALASGGGTPRVVDECETRPILGADGRVLYHLFEDPTCPDFSKGSEYTEPQTAPEPKEPEEPQIEDPKEPEPDPKPKDPPQYSE